jgi:hypothetical protein
MEKETTGHTVSEKLREWQERLSQSDNRWSAEVEKMNERESIYNGLRTMTPLVPGDTHRDGTKKKTSHVRNITFENIESQVSSAIPQPKVTPRRKKDEHLANVIEHFLRNELDRLPFEAINDLAERTVPIQGGVGFLVEWDNTKRTSTTVGEVNVTLVHPKQFAPQPDVYTSIADMDYFIVKVPTTKGCIERRYGVVLETEGESEPDIRGGDGSTSEENLTLYIGYALNDHGGIDRYTWVNDTELESLEDYQARRQPVCERCGKVKPLAGQEVNGSIYAGGACPWCGGKKWDERVQDFEELRVPVHRSDGTFLGGTEAAGEPTKIPFYRPDCYPIVLQRSVSVYGQLLGNSDVDMIRDQQNTSNRIEQKIIDRLMKAGTRITLPDRVDLRTDPEDGERWYIGKPSDKQLIDVYDFSGNLQYELTYLSQVYEEARQIIGITDSFQGRRDATATSGKAKEFSAAQAAGRLESKRVMKNAAYAELFEVMFKFWLAYSDEPRPVTYKDSTGETVYEEFNRYDFLETGEDGEWHWNDQFLFSCDTSAPLASNREAMWQETRQNLQTGAFGDPTDIETLILFWAKMEELHYPGAGQTKKHLEEKAQRAEEMQRMQQQAQGTPQEMPEGGAAGEELPPEVLAAVEAQAQQDAMRAASGQAEGLYSPQ